MKGRRVEAGRPCYSEQTVVVKQPGAHSLPKVFNTGFPSYYLSYNLHFILILLISQARHSNRGDLPKAGKVLASTGSQTGFE